VNFFFFFFDQAIIYTWRAFLQATVVWRSVFKRLSRLITRLWLLRLVSGLKISSVFLLMRSKTKTKHTLYARLFRALSKLQVIRPEIDCFISPFAPTSRTYNNDPIPKNLTREVDLEDNIIFWFITAWIQLWYFCMRLLLVKLTVVLVLLAADEYFYIWIYFGSLH